MEFLIISMVFSYFLVRNTTQDLVFKATGKLPPSYLREQERWKRKQSRRPLSERRAAQRFFVNAWDDAWESALEKRQHATEKKRARRREEWAREDKQERQPRQAARGEDDSPPIPDPVDLTREPPEPARQRPTPDEPRPDATPRATHKPEPDRAPVHDDDSYGPPPIPQNTEASYRRYALRRRNGQPMTAKAIAEELGVTEAEARRLRTRWDARYDREAPGIEKPPQHLLDYQKHTRCRDCDGEIQIEKDPDRLGWIVRVIHKDQCPQDQASGTAPSPAAPSINGTENPMTANAETTSLSAALSYTEDMAKSAEEGVSSVETSIASMQAGEVEGEAITHLHAAQEALTTAAAEFQAAHDELTSHVSVQEAYSANEGAGNKQFVTQD